MFEGLIEFIESQRVHARQPDRRARRPGALQAQRIVC
jgi:hypothetical protein